MGCGSIRHGVMIAEGLSLPGVAARGLDEGVEAIDELGVLFAPDPQREGYFLGWRVEGAGPEPGALIRDVLQVENEERGKDIDVPEELLAAMDAAGLWAGDIIWVCRSAQEAVLRYGEMGADDPDYIVNEETIAGFNGNVEEARAVEFGPSALVLGTDDDGGYLVLWDASKLDRAMVEGFKARRRLETAADKDLG